MSSKQEKKTYAFGAIVRIKLENFVTYDSLEFKPGANLNVIIGPNGTGKSSIVCAICLGLAGKPKDLGRAAAISDYIKYGKNQALIEIELNNQTGPNDVIRRIIYSDNKNDWFHNGKPAKLREIEEIISEKNIQVNNLCQFLPQEKVAEFARQDQYQLLRCTENAVGGQDLVKKHDDLESFSKDTREQEKELAKIGENLKKEEAINARMENIVQSYLERKRNEDEVIWLKRKRSLTIYTQKNEEKKEAENQQRRIYNEIKEYQSQQVPLQRRKEDITQRLDRLKNILSAKNHEINENCKILQTISTRLTDQSDKAAEIKAEYQDKDNQIKHRLKEREELRKSIEDLRTKIEEDNIDINAIREEEKNYRNQESELRKQISAISQKEYENRNQYESRRRELEMIRNTKNEINNIRNSKLTMLKRNNSALCQSVCKAIEWIERNKQNFKGQVFEPMFLHINIKIPSLAKFVEHTIATRDLMSLFLFENSEDMDFFMREVRQKMNCSVNFAKIPSKPSCEYQPPRLINQIRRHGISHYIRDIIDAPEAILSYLCLYYKIHQVPIGNKHTYDHISEVMSEIPEFYRVYAENYLYQATRSRYTNKLSTTSGEVYEPQWLKDSVDADKLAELDEKESELTSELQQLSENIKECLDKKKEFEKQIEQNRREIGKINEKLLYVNNNNKKYEILTMRLNKNESESTDMISDAKLKAKQYYVLCGKRSKLVNEILEMTNNLIGLYKDKIFSAYQESQLQTEKRKIETEIRDTFTKNQELQESKDKIDNQVRALKEEAKQLLAHASRLNEIRLDTGVLPEEYAIKFKEFPDTIEELDSKIHQFEAIASCSSDVNEKLVDEYNERKRLIEKLQKEYEKRKHKLDNHTQTYEELKNEWIDNVEEMISKINEKFTALFRQLRCAGEICLTRPDAPDDFAKYGIIIKVSFRSDEQMQELTAWQQSGGEKSVSTMMYMIALQEMTKCPFRVVDEINQGMDPVNERKVFDIIVQNSCAKQFAQYFLLTPKLLPDLSFDEKTNVICVFNGPHALPHAMYNLRQFIQTRRQLNDANQG